MQSNFSVFFSRRFLAILVLGFSSGLPLALTSTTLQAWYTVAGISLITIGILSLVGQPYVFKFLWAPLLDRFIWPLLGRRRGWILCMQILLVIGIATMAFMQPQLQPWLIAMLALAISFFSATQDIAINAYTTDALNNAEFGLGAALTSAGYRIAMIISGALALILAELFSWHSMWLIMAGLMAISIIATLFAPEPKRVYAPTTLQQAVIEPWRIFIKRPSIMVILLFIIFYKISDAMITVLGPTFLLRGVGFNLMEVGAIYKVVGLSATLLGAFIAGLWMVRLSIFRALLGFGLLQACSGLAFMALALVGKNYELMVFAVFVENFAQGMAMVAFVAFLMSLCDSRYTATQFALLSALAAIARVFIGPVAGVMAQDFGWPMFYFCSFVLAFPGLLLLWYLREIIEGPAVVSTVTPVIEN